MTAETTARSTASDDYAGVRAVPNLPGVTQAERAAAEALDGLIQGLHELRDRLSQRVLRPDHKARANEGEAEDSVAGSDLAESLRGLERRIATANHVVLDVLDRLDV